MHNAIEIRDLRYAYPDDQTAEHVVFEDLNLDIRQGSFVAVLGHKGCGKSTLAKHFKRHLLPEGGSVTVYGLDTKQEENLLAIRQQVGMVFQNPDNQIVSNVVEEDVAFARRISALPRRKSAAAWIRLWRQSECSRIKSMRRTFFPAGRSSAVAIAGVLAMQPKTIVLDEPTAMLDPQGRQEVVSIVEKLSREQNITVVLITHHMDEAVCADRVIAMDDGKIIADGTPKRSLCAD